MDISTVLRASKLIHAEEAASALAGGWVARPFGETKSSELERIYAIRHTHLLSKLGPYAQELANSVGEFLIGLRANIGSSVQMFEVRGDAEHDFLVFLTGSNVIGCLRTVSQLDVIPDTLWRELQGAP